MKHSVFALHWFRHISICFYLLHLESNLITNTTHVIFVMCSYCVLNVFRGESTYVYNSDSFIVTKLPHCRVLFHKKKWKCCKCWDLFKFSISFGHCCCICCVFIIFLLFCMDNRPRIIYIRKNLIQL